MRKNYILLLLVGLLVACSKPKKEVPPVATQADLLAQARSCSRIYASEYVVSKVVVRRDERKLHAHVLGMDVNMSLMGGERVTAVPVEGVVKTYVDMSMIAAEDIRRQGDTLEVILPDPSIEVTGTRILHDEVREKVGLLQSDFTDAERMALQRQGRDSIVADLPRLGLVAAARESAARTLVPLFVGLGFKEEDITITFRQSDERMSAPHVIQNRIVAGR